MRKVLLMIAVTFFLGNLLFIYSCKKDDSQNDDSNNYNTSGSEDYPLPYEYHSWMSSIPDATFLFDLSIPGTHDAAADEHTSQQAGGIYVVCQDYYIYNQMMLGVRFFDIRLNLADDNSTLTAFHWHYYLHKNFNDLLEAAINFLDEYPDETIIYMIKQENSSKSATTFANAVYNYLENKSPDMSLFYLGHTVPMLGQVRGKIVILSRYDPTEKSKRGMYVDWSDNTKGEHFNHCDFPLWVQDHYSLNTVSSSTKASEIETGIRLSQEDTTARLYLNFLSGERVKALEGVDVTTEDIYEAVVPYIKDHLASMRMGVLMLNFAGGLDPNDNNSGCTIYPELVEDIAIGGNILYFIEEPWVILGLQMWMKYNLDVTNYSNGDPIPRVDDPEEWVQQTSGAYCVYGNELSGYGILYNWYAVTDPRGLAPEGWRIPSQGDWEALYKLLNWDAGSLKEKGTRHWQSPNTAATNGSQFTALPGGYREPEYGYFMDIGEQGWWWTSTGDTSGATGYGLFSYDNVLAFYHDRSPVYGFSVRLVRDL